MTSKEYLINCHVLLKHFELVFIPRQLVKISCKLLIIWVNYGKNKKGSFLWNIVYVKYRVGHKKPSPCMSANYVFQE